MKRTRREKCEIVESVKRARGRVCTRLDERPVTRRKGLIATGADNAGDLELKGELRHCMPSSAEYENWTNRQEKALRETLLAIKPGVKFWQLVAERVPGKSAKECSEKFYSGRTTTRTAKRSRASVKLDISLSERSGSKRVKSLQGTVPVIVKTPGRETRASQQATLAPAEIETKKSRKGYVAGKYLQRTVATETKRNIEAGSNSPDVQQIKDTKSKTKVKGGTLGQRAGNGLKSKTGRLVFVVSRASAPTGAQVSELDRSCDSDDGDENNSASGASLDCNVWTHDQEKALQMAYATIKPSANFWHLISKQVPGRSAEECFNRFYSGHPTPPRVRPRSCLKEFDCSPSLPRRSKAKTTGRKRLLEVQRTVRNILRKQQVDDEDYEADAFAALEPPHVVHSVIQRVSAISSERDEKFCVHGSLPGSTENSSTQSPPSDKENREPKPLGQSREFGTGKVGPISPEVLKRVKDPLMLDKYIDHLHQRRTRRTGTKSGQKRESGLRVRGPFELSKDGFDFREVRLDAVHRAKQELRDVFLRPSSVVDDPFLKLVDESSDGSEKDDEDDDEGGSEKCIL